jgi:uncharacterized membrane protein YbaN (DUF454 family)
MQYLHIWQNAFSILGQYSQEFISHQAVPKRLTVSYIDFVTTEIARAGPVLPMTAVVFQGVLTRLHQWILHKACGPY